MGGLAEGGALPLPGNFPYLNQGLQPIGRLPPARRLGSMNARSPPAHERTTVSAAKAWPPPVVSRARRFIRSERSKSMKRSLQVLLVTALGFLGSCLSWADVAAVGTGTGVALATGGGAVAVGSAVAVALSSGGCDCDDDDSAAAVAVGTGVALALGGGGGGRGGAGAGGRLALLSHSR